MTLFAKNNIHDYSINGYYSLGSSSKIATYDQKHGWLKTLEQIEADHKNGLNNHVIHRRAQDLLNEIMEYDNWPYEGVWIGQDIPERLLYVQRLAAIKIETGSKLTNEEVAIEVQHDPKVQATIKISKENEGLIDTAKKLGEDAKKMSELNPLQRDIDKNISILDEAAKKTASDLKNPIAALAGDYKYLVYAGIGIAGITVMASIFAPYMTAFNSVRKRRNRRRRRRFR